MAHTHAYDELRKDPSHRGRKDESHDHAGGDHPHIHDGLSDDAYIKRVKDREKKNKK